MIRWITKAGDGLVSITVFKTDWGYTGLVCRDEVVLEVAFGRIEAEVLLDTLRQNHPTATVVPRGMPGLREAVRCYFGGEPAVAFDCAVDVSWATPFTRAVLKRCAAIPAGRTMTYRELAQRSGAPGAARAVGQAMARNPVPILIPCHRVVRTGGGLGGYSAADGTATKQALLDYERNGNLRVDPRQLRLAARESRAGPSLQMSPV